MSNYIDLHIHSNNSDGKYSISELVKISKENRVSVMSITDHDDLRSVKEIKKIDTDIKCVNGIELSSITNINGSNKMIHILGYDFDENNQELNESLNSKKELRKNVNIQYLIDMIKELNFIKEDILDKIDCSIFIRFSRLIYKYIEENEFTVEQIKIVKEYIEKVKIVYEGYNFEDKKAIKLIHNAGGIAVLAHPYQYGLMNNQEDILLERLMSYGLEGLEICHSGDTEKGFELQQYYANKYGLLTSVGSDFHTDEDEINRIGTGINNNLCKTSCSILKRIK